MRLVDQIVVDAPERSGFGDELSHPPPLNPEEISRSSAAAK